MRDKKPYNEEELRQLLEYAKQRALLEKKIIEQTHKSLEQFILDIFIEIGIKAGYTYEMICHFISQLHYGIKQGWNYGREKAKSKNELTRKSIDERCGISDKNTDKESENADNDLNSVSLSEGIWEETDES